MKFSKYTGKKILLYVCMFAISDKESNNNSESNVNLNDRNEDRETRLNLI